MHHAFHATVPFSHYNPYFLCNRVMVRCIGADSNNKNITFDAA